jgi:hypothetical protein
MPELPDWVQVGVRLQPRNAVEPYERGPTDIILNLRNSPSDVVHVLNLTSRAVFEMTREAFLDRFELYQEPLPSLVIPALPEAPPLGEGVPSVQLGQVLEDANGYCLMITEIDVPGGFLIARDFPEQVIDPCILVLRTFRLIANFSDFFVIRNPTPEEVDRFQRALMGSALPSSRSSVRPDRQDVLLSIWETLPSGDSVRWDETHREPAPPSRFDREVEIDDGSDTDDEDPG